MSLSSLRSLLDEAAVNRCAVGAFNVGNMEMLLGILRAAEALNRPVILQVAEKRLPHTPLHLIAPMIVSAARAATVDVAVHLDHGFSTNIIKEAVAFGFTSIMFDGSGLPLAENMARTRELAHWLHPLGIDLEAEIGVLGGAEGGAELHAAHSDPEEAEAMARESLCDALAVSFGNAHGHYKGKPRLAFDVLETLSSRVQVPLVLHGGTGLSPADFARAISLGIRKINIATAQFDALTAGARTHLARHAAATYFSLNEAMVDEVCRSVTRHLQQFGPTESAPVAASIANPKENMS